MQQKRGNAQSSQLFAHPPGSEEEIQSWDFLFSVALLPWLLLQRKGKPIVGQIWVILVMGLWHGATATASMEMENYNWELLLGFQTVKQVGVDSSNDTTEEKMEWSAKF